MHFEGINEPKTMEKTREPQRGETGTKRPDVPAPGQYDIKQWLYWSY